MKPDIASRTAQQNYCIPRSVRAVLFDAVGTLLVPHPPVAEAYLAAGRQFGSRLELAQVRRRFREAFQRQEQFDAGDREQPTSEGRERRRWQTIVAEVFGDVDDQAGLFESLWQHFGRVEHWLLFEDVPLAWTRLSEAGWRLGLASNFDARLEWIAAGMPPLAQADGVFVSSRLGYRKPSAKFFQAIERSLALRPEQLLLVGDDLVNDYLGARAAGWHAVLLARHATAAPEVEHWITSLDQLDTAS